MNVLGPTRLKRLNEVIALVYLFCGLFLLFSFISFTPQDPSWDSVSTTLRPHNLTGRAGAYISDFCLQFFGIAAFALPVLLWILAWKWIRSQPIEAAVIKLIGIGLLIAGVCTGLALGPRIRLWQGAFTPGGVLGILLGDYLTASLNLTGAWLLTALVFILSFYLVSRFSVSQGAQWLSKLQAFLDELYGRWTAWRSSRTKMAVERAKSRAAKREAARAQKASLEPSTPEPKARRPRPAATAVQEDVDQEIPASTSPEPDKSDSDADEIPIHELEYEPSRPEPVYIGAPAPTAVPDLPWESAKTSPPAGRLEHPDYHLPSTELLHEPPPKTAFDSLELKDIAARIKSKLEEFNVLGNITQINPGPVVTTFEFKPEAGIKYSRITTLNDDLCLGLQAESVLIERIPGKPTVGVEVPNSRREVISLRQILESEEFLNSPSKMTICLGKDINGRIKVAAMESMPHLLIAGSTGSGKSVMLNSMIMSILYKATPDEVRLIMIDPKRLELGLYEGIPHLLTPVITDAKKATNALRNAVLEMERRLKLLASQGVRNIDQYNRKVKQLQQQPRNLFEDDGVVEEELNPLPYILILIDELADLMMLERGNVEEAVTRLAQMARAVGMHLVLATQRPSVDVITGLIKANFPSRISFRVATRVDSRTVLDVMGAEHLLGKGDMLFLPPGSSRLSRVHGAFVTEAETNRVVEFWKAQARPDYDQTFLMPPPADEEESSEEEEVDTVQDAMYQDAVRVVLEMGKASTSTLQRRLRLGYGRAARILDMMQRDGIIGPPDGSKPREVLKRPDWLAEVEAQVR
ncbi:MAG: DNA translocase FtsK [Acidobacteriota bacterium]|nr:DNA translocase FtsK [Acidobacteriota bacterium]